MPIVLMRGNLLESKCDILVNTVNCHGVMGAGIALDFKRQFPSMYKQYVADCNRGLYQPGKFREYPLRDGRIIANFATKDHWQNPSKIEWIANGLKDLRAYLSGTTYSIAIPALGCNNGKLKWSEVLELIYVQLDGLENHIEVYQPWR